MSLFARTATAAGSTLALAVGGLILSTAGTAHAATCSTGYLPLPDPACTPAPTTRT